MSRMLCLGCNQPSRVDLGKCKPGEIHYQPCSCGAIGIYRDGDEHAGRAADLPKPARKRAPRKGSSEKGIQ